MTDEATERITILLQARDRDLARAIDRSNKLISNYERNATRATTTAGRNIDSNMGKAGRAMTAFGGIVGALTVGALAGLATGVRSAISEIDGLAKASARVGIDVESFQGLQRGFGLAGVEATTLNSALEIFTQRIGEAEDGSSDFAKVLRRNRVALRDQSGEIRPTLDLFRDYADIVSGASSEAEKMALANDAFGRGGRAMSQAFEGGSAALDDMIQSARDGGYIISEEVTKKAEELDDRFSDLTLKAGNFFKVLSVGAADFVVDVALMRAALDTLFDSPEQADAILGPELANALRLNVDAATAAGDAVSDLRQVYMDMANQADALVGPISMMATTLDAWGQTEAASALREVVAELQTLSADLSDGTITAAEFMTALRDTSDRAIDVANNLDAVDRAEFGGVISGINSLRGSLTAALAVARDLVATIPGSGVVASGVSVTPGTPGSPVTSGLGTAPIPVMTAEEERRLRQSYVVNALTRGLAPDSPVVHGDTGSAGGSPGGSAAPMGEPEYWDDLIASVGKAEEQFDALQQSAESGAETMAELFTSILDGSMTAKEALAGLLQELAKVSMQKALLGLSGMGGGVGSAFSMLGDVMTFDGGGYTGSGARSGGMDGKGGFMAMVHPNETVVDHSKGQGGGIMAINVNVSGVSGDQAIQSAVSRGVAQGLAQYDSALPSRVRNITSDPRRI